MCFRIFNFLSLYYHAYEKLGYRLCRALKSPRRLVAGAANEVRNIIAFCFSQLRLRLISIRPYLFIAAAHLHALIVVQFLQGGVPVCLQAVRTLRVLADNSIGHVENTLNMSRCACHSLSDKWRHVQKAAAARAAAARAAAAAAYDIDIIEA